MTPREFARSIYKQIVESEPMNEDLRRSLRAHERVPLFIDNLTRELEKLGGTNLKKETIEQAVGDLTRFFINACQTSRDQKMLSTMARLSLEAKIAERKRLRDEAQNLNARSTDHVHSEEKGQTFQSETEFKA